MIRRHSSTSLYRLSAAAVDSDDARGTSSSLDDISIAESGASTSTTCIDGVDTVDAAPRRPISRSNSLSNLSSKAAAVASLGLIAGAEAFAATSSSTGRMTRHGSMESVSSEQHSHGPAGNTLSRSASARSLVSASSTCGGSAVPSVCASSATSLNMADPAAMMDVGAHMSSLLDGFDGSGIDVPAAVRTSTDLLSRISNTEMISSALVGAANRVFSGDEKKVEATVFGDLSLGAGLMTLAGATKNKAALEATGLASRVFGLISDYLPDGVVSPDEAIFQACMMAISAASLAKAIRPVVPAGYSHQPTTYHEKKVYSQLFKKFGNMSWLQYKKLLAGTADWVDLDRYESVEDKVPDHDDAKYLYLVARGDAFDLDVDSSSLGLMGTLNLADKIKHLGRKEKNGDANNGRRPGPAQVCAPRAGASGAKLLRIDTTKLLGLMEADEAMADSIKSIVFADMQEKLMDFCVSSQSAAAQEENPQLPGEVAFVQ